MGLLIPFFLPNTVFSAYVLKEPKEEVYIRKCMSFVTLDLNSVFSMVVDI